MTQGMAKKTASHRHSIWREQCALPTLGSLLMQLGWPQAEINESHAFHALVGADLERVRLDQELNAIERAYAIQTSGITPIDIDDGQAIVLALASPEIELLGCTTCGGN